MNITERRLLKEIKNCFRPVLTEAIRDFTFAMIEPKLPSPENREYETLIHVYGMKRATQRGATHVGKKFDDEGNPIVCPMCGVPQGQDLPPSQVSIGDGIRARIDEVKSEIAATEKAAVTASGKKQQNLNNWANTLRNDLDYLDDALDRYTESGKAEEKVLCPKCTGWQWADIEEYKDQNTGAYRERTAKKHPLPWEMFIDWLWKTLEGAGLNPDQAAVDPKAAGFKGPKDRYGANQPKPNEGPMKHIVIVTDSLGKTVASINSKLGKILQQGDQTFFTIHRWPDEDMMDRYELAIARSMDKMTPAELKQADEFEEWLDENRGFYVSAKISGSAYGEELGLPEFEVTGAVDTSKLLMKLRGEKVPLTVGNPPPRAGEWGTYSKSIKTTGAQRRAARSGAAHETQRETKDKISSWFDKGVSIRDIKDRLQSEFEDNYINRRTKPRDQWSTAEINRFNNVVNKHNAAMDKLIAQTKKEKEEAAAAAAVAKYPGSKYAYWEDEIDNLADVVFDGSVTPVAVELAVSKYFDSLGMFPKPFDIDRLDDNQAVEAINILKAINPDEIDSLVRAAEEQINMPTEAWDLDSLAQTVISSLGSVRANAAYGTLKEMKGRPHEAAPLFESLLRSAPPLTKVAAAAPTNNPIFDSGRKEFWQNIINGNVICYNKITESNARKLRSFYRYKINKEAPWLLESLAKLLLGGSSCSVLSSVLDSTISGRPLLREKYDAVKEAAKRCGVGGLVE